MKMTRRTFVTGLGATFLASRTSHSFAADTPLVRFGLVADCHYCNKAHAAAANPTGDRYYADSLLKMKAFVAKMNAEKVDFVAELGDFKDTAGSAESALNSLAAIESAFAMFEGPRYHVLGNHDMDSISKSQFLSGVVNTGFPTALGYYHFRKNGVNFIVLDNCFSADSDAADYDCNGDSVWQTAYTPPTEREWLADTLASVSGRVIVLSHQRLDPNAWTDHATKNAAAVRQILERSGKVKMVFSGHEHTGGACNLNGVCYYSLQALVLGPAASQNSFAEVSVYASGGVGITRHSSCDCENALLTRVDKVGTIWA